MILAYYDGHSLGLVGAILVIAAVALELGWMRWRRRRRRREED